jgi:hypothetical protein
MPTSIRSNPIPATIGASRPNSAVLTGDDHTHAFTPICAMTELPVCSLQLLTNETEGQEVRRPGEMISKQKLLLFS